MILSHSRRPWRWSFPWAWRAGGGTSPCCVHAAVYLSSPGGLSFSIAGSAITDNPACASSHISEMLHLHTSDINSVGQVPRSRDCPLYDCESTDPRTRPAPPPFKFVWVPQWDFCFLPLDLMCFSLGLLLGISASGAMVKGIFSFLSLANKLFFVCSVLSRSVLSDSFDPMDCSPPGSSVHGDSPGKNTGGRCHALLQGIFPTQGSNPGLPLWRQILYRLSHQGSPFPHRRRPMMTACSFCPEILFVIEFKLMHLGFSRDLIISAAKNWHYITPIVTTFPPIDY